MSKLYVGSEIGRLKRVILHRPERALTHLTPSNCHELLFDDVVSVEVAGQEHDAFTAQLMSQDVEVLLLHTLLSQTLNNPSAKDWLLATQISDHRFGQTFANKLRQHLAQIDDKTLGHYLLGGLTYDEIDISCQSLIAQMEKSSEFVIDPLPNHLFTRDTSSWLYNGVSLNPMMKIARQRETTHLAAIYRWHPLFADQNFHRYFDGRKFDSKANLFDNVKIEGGDILVLGNRSLLIGLSERTTAQGIEQLAEQLFANGEVDQIIVLELPKDRSCMHLDTVMTHLTHDTFSIYPEIITENMHTWRLTAKPDGSIAAKKMPNFKKAIEQVLQLDALQIITTGGNNFEAQREQWNDANNVLTVKPGVVISYERNTFTNEKYDKAGIKVLTIPGNELGRGRGGARCMSCPIEREDLPN